MSKISGKETKPEIQIRKYLFSRGFRYRKNVKTLEGKPDIVLKKYNAVIFINGCFWHGHDCKAGNLPKTRREFWEEKIGKNQKRDLKNYSILRKKGWKVIIVWQCDIKNKKLLNSRLLKLIHEIKL